MARRGGWACRGPGAGGTSRCPHLLPPLLLLELCDLPVPLGLRQPPPVLLFPHLLHQGHLGQGGGGGRLRGGPRPAWRGWLGGCQAGVEATRWQCLRGSGPTLSTGVEGVPPPGQPTERSGLTAGPAMQVGPVGRVQPRPPVLCSQPLVVLTQSHRQCPDILGPA